MREIREVTKKVGELERVLTKQGEETERKYTAMQMELIHRCARTILHSRSSWMLPSSCSCLSGRPGRSSGRPDQERVGLRAPWSGTGPSVHFGGANNQQPLPLAPMWPAHNGDFVFGRAASAGEAPAEPEDEKETVVVRPLELETGAEGEGDEGGAEGEQKPEDVWEVAPQLATPAKLSAAVLAPPGEDHERKVTRRHSEQG
jgi:hypothetical protein